MCVTYDLVLSTIFLCHLFASRLQVLLKRGVDDKLLSNGVTSKLPGELVLPSGCLVVVLGVENVIVVLLNLAVVLLNGVYNVHVHLLVGRHVGWSLDVSGLDWSDIADEGRAGAWNGAWESANGKHCEIEKSRMGCGEILILL